MIKTLKVDDLQFEVRWSPRRQSLQLTVDRGGELIINAPEGCAPALLEGFVREKRFWLYTKLAEKDALRQPVSPKEFVSGEGFPYLGRSYRLLLVDDQDAPLKLERGRFKLRRDDEADGRRQFVTWYSDHARRWLPRRIDEFAPRIGVEPTGLDVRDLGFRWAPAATTAPSTSTGRRSCCRPASSSTSSCTSWPTSTSGTTRRSSGAGSNGRCPTTRRGSGGGRNMGWRSWGCSPKLARSRC